MEHKLLLDETKGFDNEFNNIYKKLFTTTYQTAYRFLGNPWSAEDVASQTFLKIYQNFDQYKNQNEDQLRALCNTSVKNEVINYLRKENTKKKVIDQYILNMHVDLDEGNPEQTILTKEEQERIDRAFAKLPDSYQDILHLKYDDGLTCADIGEKLHISTKNAEVRLQRARNRLKGIVLTLVVIAIMITTIGTLDTSARFSDYFFSILRQGYYWIIRGENASYTESGDLDCKWIPQGYTLVDELHTEEISYLRYSCLTNQLYIERVQSDIPFQIESFDGSTTNIAIDGYPAIFSGTYEDYGLASLSWYNSDTGYIYSINYIGTLDEIIKIAKGVK